MMLDWFLLLLYRIWRFGPWGISVGLCHCHLLPHRQECFEKIMAWMSSWRFPEIGWPANHPFSCRILWIFHELNQPAIGDPSFIYANPHIYIYIFVWTWRDLSSKNGVPMSFWTMKYGVPELVSLPHVDSGYCSVSGNIPSKTNP